MYKYKINSTIYAPRRARRPLEYYGPQVTEEERKKSDSEGVEEVDNGIFIVSKTMGL